LALALDSFLGFALGAALAAAFHVSIFEGEAGYFAVAIALIVDRIFQLHLRANPMKAK